MSDVLLEVRGVTKRFGGFTALENVDLAVRPGERLGLIGPNGSGKTTLINCISGALWNDSGSIRFQGSEISKLPAYRRTRLGIARSFQIPRPFHSMSLLENLLVPSAYVVHLRESEGEAEAMKILAMMGLADKATGLASQLSQVELRKLELARAMAARPRLLISDEAMAGLRPAECEPMIEFLRAINRRDGLTILLIEHVMRAVMALAQSVVVLHQGEVIASGTPENIAREPAVLQCYLGASVET